MKKSLIAVVLLLTAMCSTGCLSTPAYSGHEREQIVSRNIHFEGGQIQDDLDSIWLRRPASRLTIWNIR